MNVSYSSISSQAKHLAGQAIEYIRRPKQKRRPLPFLLPLSFFHGYNNSGEMLELSLLLDCPFSNALIYSSYTTELKPNFLDGVIYCRVNANQSTPICECKRLKILDFFCFSLSIPVTSHGTEDTSLGDLILFLFYKQGGTFLFSFYNVQYLL